MHLTDFITGIGVVLAGVGLLYTGIQIRLSRKLTRSQFLLQLYQLMEQHNELHARLRGLGWPDGRSGPETVEEWIRVGRLLGLFEYIQIMVDDGLLDIDTVDELFSYRLFHLVNNEEIRKRHFESSEGWTGAHKLLASLKDRKTYMFLTGKYHPIQTLPPADERKVKQEGAQVNSHKSKLKSN